MNIIKIHENIVSQIKTDQAKLEYLIDRYKTKYTNQENNLSNNIFLTRNNIPLHYYNLEVNDIIENVKNQLHSVKISFMSNKKSDKQVQELYETYKNRVSHLNLVKFAPAKKSFKCSHCQGWSANFEFLNNNSKVCIDCGNIEKLIIYTIHHDDGERIKLSTKNVPNRRAHFKDCLIKFLGIETLNDIKISQFDQLIENIKPSFKNIENITRESISQFLKQNKQFEKFNDNITLIYMKLTQKSFYILSQDQINDIVNDFEILSKTYDDMIYNKEINQDLLEDRTSFLNSQYIIYQLFRKHKIQCDKKDFILLKTVSKKMYHDTICEVVYKKLKWRFLPVF